MNIEKEVIILVGNQGSGKTYLAHELISKFSDLGVGRVSQDDQGKNKHWENYCHFLKEDVTKIIIDRINYTREQRKKYIDKAKEYGYITTIIDITCMPEISYDRMIRRKDHPTIKDPETALRALYMYYSQYQKPNDTEADNVNDLTSFNPYILDLTEKWYNSATLSYVPYMIFGDIHGCFDEFCELYEKYRNRFSISVGDLVDKGPNVVDTLTKWMNTPGMYSCIGNHENKLLRALLGNKVTISHGLRQSLDQINASNLDKTQIILFLMSLPRIIKVGRDYIFHAGINPDKDMMHQNDGDLLYGRNWHDKIDNKKLDHRYSRRYFGHHVHPECHIAYNTFAMDGGCVYGGELRGMLMPERRLVTVKAKEVYMEPVEEQELSELDGLKAFDEQVKLGYVRKVESEDNKLLLYNYTERCEYDGAWNYVTSQCRGIIFEKETGKCIARPFRKFFNINTKDETKVENLPKATYSCFDKVDGSLGIVFNYQGKWQVATRGSFTSDQAERANNIIKKYNFSNIPTNITLLCEIIYPENRFSSGARLVTDYGSQEDLILLAANDRDVDEEFSFDYVSIVAKNTGMPLVVKYDHTIEQMIALQKTLPAEREGFVVVYDTWPNKFRVKIKGDEYMKIHRALNSITPLFYWDNMLNGIVDKAIIEVIPEEYKEEALKLADTLQQKWDTIWLEILTEMNQMHSQVVISDDREYKKYVGLYIKSNGPKHGGAFFPIINKNQQAIDKYIKNAIRPTGNVLV